MKCPNCGSALALVDEKLSFRESCSHCHTDLHACRYCKFYDPSAYNECRETSADVVKDKEAFNFCEYFSFQAPGDSEDKKQEILKSAEALFKK